MRYLIGLTALLVACGPPEAFDVALDVSEDPGLQLSEARCTVETLQPGWECCDDDSLLCGHSGPVICHSHRWAALSVAECVRVAADSRRPELATYGTFCDTNAQGFLWCPGPRAAAK